MYLQEMKTQPYGNYNLRYHRFCLPVTEIEALSKMIIAVFLRCFVSKKHPYISGTVCLLTQ
jgi:hypothetical protein